MEQILKGWKTMEVWSVSGLVVGLTVGRAAHAEPGDHIRTGDAQIVPSITLATEYRSNAYLEEGLVGGGDTAVNPGVDLKLTPKIEIDVKGADATLDFDAAYQIKKYLTPGLDNLDRYTDFTLGGSFVVLPDALLGVKLDERMSYLGYETEAYYSDDAYTEHFGNTSQGQLSVHPGGALELDAGGTFLYDDYNVPAATNIDHSVNLNTRVGYGPTFTGQWKFLPKTAIVTDFYYRWYYWDKNILNAIGDEGSPTDAGAVIGIPDFTEWQADAGIRGRFTERLVLEVLLGYGGMTYDETSVTDAAPTGFDVSSDYAEGDIGADLKGFPAALTTTVGVNYTPQDNQQFALGYRKNFEDSYFTNYLSYHYVYFRYQGLFAQKWTTQAELSYRYEAFYGEIQRQDNVIGAKLDEGYKITDFAAVGLGAGWTERASADGEHPEIEYDDFNVHASFTFTY
jgi:hypothetical protein